MQWTIQDLGAAGEFVSALAVLITLIYLAIQVRQAKIIATQSALDQRNAAGREIMLTVASSDHLAPALVKVNDLLPGEREGYEKLIELGLTPEEAERLFAYGIAMSRNYQTQFRAALSDMEKGNLDAVLKSYFTTPFGRYWFERSRTNATMSPDFAGHVAALIDEP